ncbi:ATP synthase F0 subunit 8 [Vermiconidia calcicola]|uniref:ATP synthase F0 subunit 8 n=1 Tax=Vermiconidia calcicola TaxID=1690605 RepID=A0ACC3N5T6_9PEZI|nr:ATP synthase F0 subunit 8 [Vermiconidia calcicola]
MNTQRALRAPLQMYARGIKPTAFRGVAIAPFSTKPTTTPQTQKQAPAKRSWFQGPPPPGMHMTPVKAAMPQLVPFYFVNEVAFAFTILPLLIYVFSKYILPSRMRVFAARLFTSKL